MEFDTLWGSFENQDEETKTPENLEEPEKKDEEPPKEDEPKDDPEKKGENPSKKEDTEEPPKEEKKEEPKKEEEPSDELTETFNSVSSLLEEEELMFLGEDQEYDGDAKGFANMMRDNMEVYKKKLEEDFSKREASIRAEYEKANSPKFSDLDPDQHSEVLLTEYYKRTGLEESEITEKLAELKDLDYMSKEAKIAKRYLAKEEAKEEKLAEEARQKEADKRSQEIESYISGLKSEIDESEEMAGFKMTNKIKRDFKDYIFKQDKDGLTQAQKAGKDPSRRLRLAFLDFMDFNKKDFEIKAKTEVSNDLKKKTSRFTSKGASAKGVSVETPKQEEFNPGFLDFWSAGS